MRAFAEAWPDQATMQQLAAKLPWFHHCVLLDRVRPEPAMAAAAGLLCLMCVWTPRPPSVGAISILPNPCHFEQLRRSGIPVSNIGAFIEEHRQADGRALAAEEDA
jgi:hypothetical protein